MNIFLAFLMLLLLVPNNTGEDILSACRAGDLETVKQLLLADPDQVNATDAGNYTPLHWAAARAQCEVIDELLKYHPKPDMIGWDGGTALHVLCHYDMPQYVDKLLKAGFSFNIENAWGNIPLHPAARRNCIETAKVLLEAGADINAITKEGWTPLHYANRCGHSEMIKFLLDNGADPDALDSDGKKPAEVFKARPEQVEIEGLNLEQYTGIYMVSDSFGFEVEVVDGKLQIADVATDFMYPTGKDSFFCEKEPWLARFERDADGNITNLYVSFLRQTVKGKLQREAAN